MCLVYEVMHRMGGTRVFTLAEYPSVSFILLPDVNKKLSIGSLHQIVCYHGNNTYSCTCEGITRFQRQLKGILPAHSTQTWCRHAALATLVRGRIIDGLD